MLSEVNRPLKVDSPLFSQKTYDFSEILSKCGKIWAKSKANFESQKVEFEIWEAMTEISIRQNLENLQAAKAMIKDKEGAKEGRITESRIKAEIKLDKEYRAKKQDLIEAEELYCLAEKALYEACKLRGFVSQAIVRKRQDTND